MIELPALPYANDALRPFLSQETIEYHYGKHHKAYVNNLNGLIQGTPLEQMDLETIIRSSSGKIFNNAAQVWNHSFYWNGLSPQPGAPEGPLAEAIEKGFSLFAEFQKQFEACALGAFGSCWIWLVEKPNGALDIRSTQNAEPAFLNGDTPLLTCDVWEHAYYIDYRNDRAASVKAFWKAVNWKFVESNFARRAAKSA